MADKLTGPEKFMRHSRIRRALKPYYEKAKKTKYKTISLPVSELIDLYETVEAEIGRYAEWREEDDQNV